MSATPSDCMFPISAHGSHRFRIGNSTGAFDDSESENVAIAARGPLRHG